MTLFFLHIALIAFWMALNGGKPEDLIVGFFFGWITILLGDNLWYAAPDEVYTGFRFYPFSQFNNRKRIGAELKHLGGVLRIVEYIKLVIFYLWELIKSTVIVIAHVIGLQPHQKPGIVALPVYCNRQFELVLLNALITMSPGTLGLDERIVEQPDGSRQRMLYVHCLHIPDRQEKVMELMNLQDKLLRALRGRRYSRGT